MFYLIPQYPCQRGVTLIEQPNVRTLQQPVHQQNRVPVLAVVAWQPVHGDDVTVFSNDVMNFEGDSLGRGELTGSHVIFFFRVIRVVFAIQFEGESVLRNKKKNKTEKLNAWFHIVFKYMYLTNF